jgi:hypothetical protein
VRLVFATSIEVYLASQLYLSLVTGLDVTRNISTAESPGRCMKAFFATSNKTTMLSLFVSLLVGQKRNGRIQ